MKELLYVKNNSMRCPKFRLSTAIFQEDNEKEVVKTAMCPEAAEHLMKMKENYQMLTESLSEIEYIPFQEENGRLIFPYIEGTGLLENVDVKKDAIDEIVSKITRILEEINQLEHYKNEKFYITEDFAKVFGDDIALEEECSTYPINIDSILSNYVRQGDRVFGIDYEWVVTFPVPTRFIDYRRIHYFYYENSELLKGRCEEEQFLIMFGFSPKELEQYQKMEYNFQQYVHGKNIKYFYLPKYEKQKIDRSYLSNLREQIESKDTHIKNLGGIIESKDIHINNLDEVIASKEECISNLSSEIDSNNQMISSLNEVIISKDADIKRLEEIAQERMDAIEEQRGYIEKLRRMIRNPFYAAYVVSKKVCKKLRGFVNTNNVENNAENDIDYFEKYKHLINPEVVEYEEWITGIEAEYKCDETFSYNPKISILVPVYNVLDKHLVPCIESVLNQTYTNWELCLADDNSTWENVRTTLEKYRDNEKVKIVYRTENGHISRCTNSALEVATGEYVAFLDCDDVLAENALYEMVKCLNDNPELDFIYSDEDKIDDDGNNRHMPHFKPDWSPDTLMSHMYTCHFGVYRRSIAMEIGGLREGVEGAQDYDFTLRFTEITQKVGHVDKILYHWRERNESTAVNPESKPYILEAAKKAKEDALKRRGLNAELELIEGIYKYRVNYIPSESAFVSIIIPSKDNYEILHKCISSLTEITEYKRYEIIVVDNGSTDKNREMYQKLVDSVNGLYLYEQMDFNFSKMCNMGANVAKGNLLLFLNDDIEIIEPKWLERMAGHAELSHVGAVGAKLLYPNSNLIQHAGVVSIYDGPVHAFGRMSDDNNYFFDRNKIDYNWLAVTAACLMVSKEKFDQIGGFEEELAVAYNDVDLCFKLVEYGYYNVSKTNVILIHHESLSRGDDTEDPKKMERLIRERNKLYDRHPQYYRRDPFYNINLAQNRADFAVGCINARKKTKVEKFNEIPQIKENTFFNIDKLDVEKTIYMEGWYINPESCHNNDNDIQILLKGEKFYCIHTKKRYRPDLASAFPQIKNVEFTGFYVNADAEKIESGKYQIYVGCENLWTNTDREIYI